MSIEIKGVIIGEGKPKVCVPIVESHDEAILNKLKEFNELEVDMIELRIDFYENIHQEDALRNLFLNIANTKTSYSDNSYSCRRWRS
jgi:3-dehydroquinate dehydratase-1